MRNPLVKTKSSFLRLLLLLAIVTASSVIVIALGIIVGIPFWGADIIDKVGSEPDFNNLAVTNFYRYMQTLSHFALFIVPALFFAFLVSPSSKKYFQIKRKINPIPFLISIALILVVLPFLNFVGEWNASLVFPESMSGINTWIKASEESAMELTKGFLAVETFHAYLFNIFMIAIIPAIGEELIFRGIILKEIKSGVKNIHIAVVLSAILFSAMHMQFFGFFPRIILGIILGYLFIWSKNILFPMLIHFLNNAIAVTIAYLNNIGVINIDFESFGSFDGSIMGILVSLILSILLMYLISKTTKKKEIQT